MRKLSLRHLRCFVAIADTGSFTLAAARLFHTQSSLTATIQQFEEAVGLKLFDRTTRRVVMTEDAARFKPVAERILRDFDNAIGDLQAIAKSQRGHVRIAAAPSMIIQILTPALAEFRRAYPSITVSVRDGGSDKIERAVLEGEVDFGLCSRLNNYPELDYVPILADPFGVIFPNDHPLALTNGPIKWSDLAGYDYIGLTGDTGIGAFLETHPELGLHEKTKLYDHVSSTNSLYAMLGLGGKISVVPSLAAQASPLNEFKFRELCEPRITREICLITRHLRSFSVNTRRILEVLIDTVRQARHLNGVEVILDDSCPVLDPPDGEEGAAGRPAVGIREAVASV
ncbi:LysR family transcriptional regulator [Pigmentiphaga sp.]|uniref:LysR family transcriptional regulator n=1 Tax=Pigmentiphaga sp. TaxID=1977564 RepID=UPI0025CBF36B|nr:LysR family transcriptional regulator [Pigmentiphaga sp.]MBX6318992.1 LysR family transcriptional regulator [Pigmentiphaga sp.]